MGRVSEAQGERDPSSIPAWSGRAAAGAVEGMEVWGSYKLGSDLGVYEPWAQAKSRHLSEPLFLHL